MKIAQLQLSPRDWVPNNPALAVRLYRGALSDADDLAAAFEARFERHGWPPQWRDGVYDYHHYHSTAHEALGIAAGSATLVIGGPAGEAIEVEAGDALMLPAGTGHCRIRASADFCVVGAYPTGQEWDLCRSAADAATLARIAAVPVPARDPVTGEEFGQAGTATS